MKSTADIVLKKRSSFFGVWCALCVLFLSLFSSSWAEERFEGLVDIRRAIEVVDGVVRLEDVFTGIEKSRYKERVIVEAPAPGERFVLPADWLFRIAKSYRVKWKPLTRFDEVEVYRQSRRVTEEELKEAITRGIREKYPEERGDYLVELDNGSREWHLPATMQGELTFRRVDYNTQTGRFRATVEVEDSSSSRTFKRLPLRGLAHKMIKIPVLGRSYAKGELIDEKDIEFKSVRYNRLPAHHVTSLVDIRNMASRTRIDEGRPIKLNQVEKPLLVRNKNLVMVELVTSHLIVRLRAQALEDGHEGEVIRVKNLKSKKVFEVEVVGEKATRLITTEGANVALAPG